MFKLKNKTIIASSVFILLYIVMSLTSVAALKEGWLVEADDYEITEINLENKENYTLSITSNSSIDIYLLNVSNAGRYLANLSFEPVYSWTNVTSIDFLPNTEDFAEIYGVNHTEFLDGMEHLEVYLVVESNYELDSKVILKYKPESEFLKTLRHSMTFARFFFTMALTAYLFTKVREYKEDEEIEKSKMTRGFALTFLFASLNYFIDLLASWWGKETFQPFYPVMKYEGILIPIIGFRVDQIVMLTLLLFSNIFMIYQIEKVIGRKKNPILTILNSISICLLLLIFIVPKIIDISTIFFGLTVLITLIQILWIYGTVIRQSKGVIRLKSLCLLLGFLIPVMMGLLGGELVASNSNISYSIAHLISISALLMLKYGLD